jgi:hypothetical protein
MHAAPAGTTLTVTYGGATIENTNIHVTEVTDTRKGDNGANAIAQSALGPVDPAFADAVTATLGSGMSHTANAAWGFHSNAAGATITITGSATELGAFIAGSVSVKTAWKANSQTITSTNNNDDVNGWAIFEIVWNNPGITLGGSITPTGALTRTTSKGLSGSVTPTGALALLGVKVIDLIGSITPVGTLATTVTKSLAGSITPTGTLTRTLLKRFLYPLAAGTLNLIAKTTDALNLTSHAEDTLELDPLEDDER